MLLPITLIIPTYNEEKNVSKILYNINLLKPKEVFIVDGGSKDRTKFLLKNKKVISSKKSRGYQLDIGAKKSNQLWLMFLHADTTLNVSNVKEIHKFLEKDNLLKIAYFKLKFDFSSHTANFIANWANLRTKFFYLPFGDQCLLISKVYYKKIGGFSKIPIMEDMDLVLKIPKNNKILFNSYVKTSFNKYKKNGVFKQSLKNICSQIKFLIR